MLENWFDYDWKANISEWVSLKDLKSKKLAQFRAVIVTRDCNND